MDTLNPIHTTTGPNRRQNTLINIQFMSHKDATKNTHAHYLVKRENPAPRAIPANGTRSNVLISLYSDGVTTFPLYIIPLY